MGVNARVYKIIEMCEVSTLDYKIIEMCEVSTLDYKITKICVKYLQGVPKKCPPNVTCRSRDTMACSSSCRVSCDLGGRETRDYYSGETLQKSRY